MSGFDISKVDFSYNKADIKSERRNYRTGQTYEWQIVEAEVAPTKADDKLMLKLKVAAVNGETNEPMKLTVFHNVLVPVAYNGNAAPKTAGIWFQFLRAVDTEKFGAFGAVERDTVTGKKIYHGKDGSVLDNTQIASALTAANELAMDSIPEILANPGTLVGLRFFALRENQKNSSEYQEMRDVSATPEKDGKSVTVVYDPSEMLTK